MGFIDYVIEYFRGPAGADGPQGPPGADASSDLHELTPPNLWDGGVPDPDTYTANFTIPTGAVLVSVTIDLRPYTTATLSGTLTVDQTGQETFTASYDLISTTASTGNLRVLYRLSE